MLSAQQYSDANKYGKYTLSLSGNMLRMEGSGVVTGDIVQRYNEHMQSLIQSLDGKEWGFLGYISGNGVLTDSAEQDFIQRFQWRKEQGMIACAIVTESATIPAMVQNQMRRIYEGAGINHCFFDDETSAISWLAKYQCYA